MSNRVPISIQSVESILEENDVKIREIKASVDQYFEETGYRKRACIKTYGCQMNEHDSEKLDAMLMDMGYVMTEKMEDADLIVFNTCCVRENAELKVYGNLGRVKNLKKKNPNLILAVCGCMMQQPHVVEAIKHKYAYVDLVFGTHNLHHFPGLLSEAMHADKTVIEVWDTEGQVIEGLQVNRKKSLKGFVNIMYGCNNFCAYCIVPYTRGRERSRRPEDILEEVATMAAEGTKEIMLLGQNVNSYGKTLKPVIDFADLLERVSEVEGIERIRFMTSHPKDISQKLLELMASNDKICKSLHLPIQAGSNRILKNMNRHYTREQYLDIVDRARALMPDVGISTDIIVGFPGETEADFEETLDIIRRVNYDSAFTYLYSRRTGTPAATLPDQVPEAEKHARIDRLLKVLNPMINARMKSYKDTVFEVLVEGPSKNNPAILMGRTSQSHTVNFPGEASWIGETIQVKITRPKLFSLYGERI
ncbi:MAG: tRNA-2-methylthio-N6-dimethylallyladenosine synthase [Clostridiales bacterium]|nr:tRNA-2-methylthio-N6-dimethylallyladenosine synthase [Clostridiales bacterium]